MLDFFNNEIATLLVNLIVIMGMLLFLFYGFRNFFSKFISEKLKINIQTSSTTQNIFTFTSVVIVSTFLDLFSNQKYDMLWIVLIISILTIIFSFIYEQVSNTSNVVKTNEEYSRSLNLIEHIFSCKGYNLIKNAKEIENIENSSDEIYIFSENLITDIPQSEDINGHYDNSGLFFDVVSKNIPNGKKYIYFLKDTEINRNFQISYYKNHFNNPLKEEFKKNITFYFINESDFCFFSEIYLYKIKGAKDRSFEWIPSLGELNNVDKQFYLELSPQQTQVLNEMICELIISLDKVYIKEN